MLQRLGIRGKLLAVVAVPTIVLLFATAFVVWNATAEFTSARNTSQLISLAGDSAPLVEQLQGERANASNYLRATTDGSSKRVTARTDTSRALALIEQVAVDNPSLEPFVQQVVAITAGSTTERSLDDTRAVATVDTVSGEFASWPEPDAVATAIEDFLRMADALDALAPQAPSPEVGALLTDAAQKMRIESDATSIFLNEAARYAKALPDNFSAVDRARATYGSTARDVSNRSENARVRELVLQVDTALEEIDALRSRVRVGTIVPATAENQYTDLINDLITMTRSIANTVPDRDLAAYLGAYASMQELVEAVKLEESYVERETRQGYYLAGEYTAFQARYFGSNNARDNAELAVEPLDGIDPVPEFGASYSQINGVGFEAIRDELIRDPSPEVLIAQRDKDWNTQVGEELAVMEPIRADIFTVVNDQSANLARTSLIQTLATVVGAALIIAASLFITFAIARRIVNPLRRLTTTATAVRQELPRLVERVAMPGQTVDVSEVQIPVESRDEVGRLAEAFNSINAATLSIAAEQAALRGSISEMFVNVARRDQVLLNRQLASIDEMERTEDNQETLTKLFALDHLATRMRRNSESLLVLAGIDTGRRLRRPMPLSDVIRTASSEIELYERVQLELDADPAMLGHSALTAAHLFAELLENATVFSDPGTPVVVRTMERDGAFVVTVTDSGIGMTPEELGEANSRVASTAASEILGAQRLGLFVVGRIARRVGARVQLESGESKGTIATVVMPPSMFDTAAGYSQSHQSSSAADSTTHAPAAIVHHVAENQEIEAVTPNTRGLSAYQPTVIEGAPLVAGRAGDVPAEAAPAVRVPESAELDSLLAADAASAPTAVAFDLEEFTEGATPAGLPTRRRKAPQGPEAKQDTNSIIALPQRASDAQLSALESAATTGFTPILAADEVSPESAQQRSRVFRGFRPLRAAGADGTEFTPDGESLGHAVRRGAPDLDVVVEIEPSTVSASIPLLEADPEVEQAQPAAEAPAAVSEPEPEPEPAVEPEQASELEPEPVYAPPAPPEVAPFAVEAADPRDDIAAVVHQSPLIATGYVGDDVFGAPVSHDELSAHNALLVPQLEDDDEPRPSLPLPLVAPGASYGAPAWSRDDRTAGVESVSLEDLAPQAPASAPVPAPQYSAPQYSAPQYSTPQQSAPQAYGAPAADSSQAGVYRSPLYPASPAPSAWQQPPAPEPQFEPDPVTSSPSLDDLILDGANANAADDKAGFFSRIFGKGRKGAPAPSEARRPTAPAVVLAPVGPPTGGVTTPAPSWSAPVRDDVVWPQTQPAAEQAAPVSEPIAAQGFPPPAFQAPGFPPPAFQAPAFQAPAPQAPAPQAYDATPSYATPAVPFEVPPAVPAPQSFAPAPYAAPGATPAPAYEQSLPGEPWREQESLPTTWPGASAPSPLAAPLAPAPTLFGAPELAHTYSPDQLARPLGWETAGASALQAAAPEVATEYRPVVQINPEPFAAGETDFASAVFSELSSLAAERPKVEKTRAGLAKRTPVQVEVPQVVDPSSIAPTAPRDADAVRSRFSAFYSGTQRARTDVQNFNDSTQGSLTES